MQTSDRIIEAATRLIKEKGYRGVSTKAIATEAKVNESTIFRQFGSKQGILEAIIERHSDIPQFEKLLNEDATEHPEVDLLNVSQQYRLFFHKHADIILIGIRDTGMLPELDRVLADPPVKLHYLLAEYFERLQKKKIIAKQDARLTAMSFLSMCYGFQMSELIHRQYQSQLVTEEEFYKHSVSLFVKGILLQS
ncbi:TetR/AcrR family transcriptional regulator [Paenibacillus barcinonensis]|uniref:TetR family transcriptional regulator n=1 Tax=Paenibacillus barcinonensis TaxID=198119 RepID=A0A2V4VGM2_PAEBA|nr:TetR/AcrR family transcriptional regulator [Paenibacillus barcinonensis]PYE47888.1 TetR family transcriptional regulator [Paenibacillus barcinonensis]QKS59028.1 TetR/AcrR family transcriptional regulator [Paenibacillus barcinonensis]